MTTASKFQTWAAQHGYIGLLSGVHPDDFVTGLRKAYNAGRKSIQLPVSPTPAQRTRFNHLLDKHRHMLPLDGAVLKGYDILALLNVALGIDHPYGRDKGATPLDRDAQEEIGCTHPEGCTRCNWCGFDAALPIRTGPLVDEWRVGLFWSSGSPGTQVRMIATGAAQIAEYGAHKDFISWVYSEQTYSQPPKKTST